MRSSLPAHAPAQVPHEPRVAPAIVALVPARRAFCLAGLGMLSGCTLVNMDPMPRVAVGASAREAYERRLAQLERLDDWNVRGRMALRTADDNVNARVTWNQAGERYKINLANPLGQTLVQLRGEPGLVNLRNDKGEEREASSPEALLASVTGWSMPVSALRHWLLGRPDPNVDVDTLDTDSAGRPLSLVQSGWTVDYTAYVTVDGVELPARVNLERDAISAKIILAHWQG